MVCIICVKSNSSQLASKSIASWSKWLHPAKKCMQYTKRSRKEEAFFIGIWTGGENSTLWFGWISPTLRIFGLLLACGLLSCLLVCGRHRHEYHPHWKPALHMVSERQECLCFRTFYYKIKRAFSRFVVYKGVCACLGAVMAVHEQEWNVFRVPPPFFLMARTRKYEDSLTKDLISYYFLFKYYVVRKGR